MTPRYQPDWPPYAPPPYKNGNGGMSVDKITVPILLFVSALLAVAGGAAYVTKIMSDVQSGIEKLNAKMDGIKEAANDRVTRLENEMLAGTAIRYTKQDHELFCARTERLNPNWRCAPMYSELPQPKLQEYGMNEMPKWPAVTTIK